MSVSTTPAFTWGAANGVTNYTIQIATDNTFTNMVVNQSAIAATTFTPGSALNAATTYFWRVIAANAFGSTPSTEPFWTFTTS